MFSSDISSNRFCHDDAFALVARIPIEERDDGEVRHVGGLDRHGVHATVAIAPDWMPVANPAFDVTPARLIAGIVTERGVCAPGELHTLFGNET